MREIRGQLLQLEQVPVPRRDEGLVPDVIAECLCRSAGHFDLSKTEYADAWRGWGVKASKKADCGRAPSPNLARHPLPRPHRRAAFTRRLQPSVNGTGAARPRGA